MKQKPHLTILLTICLLSSLVGQQLTTTVPQRLEVRLRWRADQLGGDAIRIVILEHEGGSFESVVSTRFGYAITSKLDREKGQALCQAFRQAMAKSVKTDFCWSDPLVRICSTDSNGDTDLYTANFSLEARGLVDNLLMEDTFKTTVSEALEKTADNGNLEAYFPAWTRKLFCWNPPILHL